MTANVIISGRKRLSPMQEHVLLGWLDSPDGKVIYTDEPPIREAPARQAVATTAISSMSMPSGGVLDVVFDTAGEAIGCILSCVSDT